MHRGTSLGLWACGTVLGVLLGCNWAGAEHSATVVPAVSASTRPTIEKNFHVDMKQSVTYLASDELEGRYIGTPGIEKAARFISGTFAKLGLQPPPGQTDYFQPFEMTTGLKIDPASSLTAGKGKNWMDGVKPELSKDYQPISFSGEGTFAGGVVFVGYGITDKSQDYDDYVGIDVKGKVVLAMRYEPTDEKGYSRITKKEGEWSPHASILQKVKMAADHGAIALLLVNPPLHHENDLLMPVSRMPQIERSSLPVVQVKQTLADEMLKAGGTASLKDLEQKIDDGFKPQSKALDAVSVRGSVAFIKEQKDVCNIVGILPGKGEHADEYVVIGAHYDHLGHGGPGSLAPLSHAIHHGADDNASGTTAMMKLADVFAHMPPQPRTLVFIAFTGEEEGLIGSQHFVSHPLIPLGKVVAMLNLDMVGRVRDEKLLTGGTGTAPSFEKFVADADKDSPLKLGSFGKGGFGPSDHTSFASKHIPVLFFFSGLHLDYHRPTDTADKINYEGMQQVVDLSTKVVESMTHMPPEQYVSTYDTGGQMGMGAANDGSHVMLGVVPDYSDSTVKGVRITGTTPGSPADKAGLKDGDILVQYNDQKLDTLMDLFNALQKSKPGENVRLKVLRGGKMADVQAVLVERKG